MSASQSPLSSPRQKTGRVARNFLNLSAGEGVARLLTFAAYVYLARGLGASGYGVIAFAVGLVVYLTKLADFAIEALGVAEVARNPSAVRSFASAVITARIALTLLIMTLAAGLCWLLLPEPERTIVLLFLLTLLPIAVGTGWIYMGLQDVIPVAAAKALSGAIFLCLVVIVVHQPEDMRSVPVAQFVAEICGAIFLYLLLVRRGLGFGLRWAPDVARPLFRQGVPLVGQVMLGLLIYNSDLFFLRAMRDSATVGMYAVAYMPISFLGNITFTYSLSLLPALSREQAGSEEELSLYHTALAVLFAISLPIIIGGWWVARDVVELGFGEAYRPAGEILALLFWCLVGAVLRNCPWSALVARGQQRLLLRATLIAVLVNGVLNLALIRPYGMYGAALATVITESLICVLMLRYAAAQGLSLVPLRRLRVPALAGVCMAGALWAAGDIGLAGQVAVGVVVYGAVMTLMGAIRMDGSVPRLLV